MSLKNHHFTLNTGAKMPAIGLGTWLAKPDEVRQAVSVALKQGYRHIDAARVYGNEHEVGQALSEALSSGVCSRSDVWITSKLWNTDHTRAEAAINRTLSDIKTDYLDLYLVHWPVPFTPAEDANMLFPRNSDGDVDIDTKTSLLDTWKQMIALKKKGLTKAIGLSNVSKDAVEFIVENSDEIPSSVQVEFHPLIAPLQKELKDYCESKGIVVTAYSPLGNNRQSLPRIIDLDNVKALAAKNNRTEAQLCINWCVSNGVCCIPKSVTPHRLQSNLESLNFDLTDEERKTLNVLPNTLGTKRFNIPIQYPAPNGPWLIDLFNTEHESCAIWKAQSNGSVVVA
ncbi:hypothetical protein PaG_00182 [Moesziomyces aphidis]|uniref:NADP-dependent oxidoreductase domain-containing protein n=2 Tax=Ustilaginaceae TaxID=5268 RepID=W3VUA1_MOEAP|nr:aldo-keto reductase [Ustilago sp. SL-2014]ETS65124.1 hypothetical protein PaG_00182 [Moesziomyces aphidis]